MTAEQIRMIDAALECSNGNEINAAKRLNEAGFEIQPERILNTISKVDSLKSKWAKNIIPAPDSQSVTDLVRPNHIDEDRVVEALRKQEKQLREHLSELGFDVKQITKALAAKNLQSNFAVATLSMMGGGITDVFLKLKAEVDEILMDLRSGDPMLIEREKLLRDNLVDIVNQMQGCHQKALAAMMLQLEAKNRSAQRKKPKGMLGVTALPGSNVNIAVKNEASQ